MNSLVEKIDLLIQEKSLFKHPFYVAWSEGSLTLDSLNGYSQEYFQLVKEVPKLVTGILKYCPEDQKREISELRDEEIEHIDPWINFAKSLGVSQSLIHSYKGLSKTQESISHFKELVSSFEAGASAMYALEKEIPKVSLTKLDGLKKFYGISSHEATEYFDLHTEADIRHANLWKGILDSVPAEKHEELLAVANKSLDAQNLLLDACFEEYCKN